ncbi:hypothetical protein ACQPZX_17030 [Actinoplanes sp. CA-142083]|uniref:hypothetical protein n=1 Tax=Actinoplanes sp. CA-142083 TaxID=3239903 RepID=UPI003D8DCCE1
MPGDPPRRPAGPARRGGRPRSGDWRDLFADLDPGAAALLDTSAFEARRRDRIRFVLEQNHRRDRARNLPGFIRAALFRRFGERIVRANHAKLLPRP